MGLFSMRENGGDFNFQYDNFLIIPPPLITTMPD